MASARRGDFVTIPAGIALWSKLGGPWKQTEVLTTSPLDGVVHEVAMGNPLGTRLGTFHAIATVKCGTHGELYTVLSSQLKAKD